MAISYRAEVHGEFNTTSTVSVTSLPTGTEVDDVLFMWIIADVSSRTVTAAPSGWTAVSGTPVDAPGAGDVRGWLYTHLVNEQDTGSFTWTFSGTHSGQWIMAAFDGADEISNLVMWELSGTSSGTSHATVAKSVLDADSILILCAGTDLSASATPYYTWPSSPRAYTEIADFENGTAFTACGMAYHILSGTMTSQSETYTTANADVGCHAWVGLRPARWSRVRAVTLDNGQAYGEFFYDPVTRDCMYHRVYIDPAFTHTDFRIHLTGLDNNVTDTRLWNTGTQGGYNLLSIPTTRPRVTVETDPEDGGTNVGYTYLLELPAI